MALTQKQYEFAVSHQKAAGLKSAEQMVSALVKKEEQNKNLHKVYLNALGNEVHVRGPLVANLQKPESIREKIARFDRLALAVRTNRAIMQSVIDEYGHNDFIEEKDQLDDSFVNEGEDLDSFGEPVVAEPAKPEMSTQRVAANDAGSAVSDDESGGAAPTAPSGIPSDAEGGEN